MSHYLKVLLVVVACVGCIDAISQEKRTTNQKFDVSPSGLRFEENKGQIAEDSDLRTDILFTMKDNGMTLFFTKKGIAYQWHYTEELIGAPVAIDESTGLPMKTKEDAIPGIQKKSKATTTHTYRVDMRWLGANEEVDVVGEQTFADYNNYYYAHCPDGITNVKSYATLTYKNIYPNIDVVYYVKEGHLKYDVVLHRGGNLEDVQFAYNGHSTLKQENGQLRIETPLGFLTEGQPIAIRDQKTLPAKYSVKNNSISFEIENLTKKERELLPIIIDPYLAWGSYYGGTNYDFGNAVSVDGSGNVYLAGSSESTAGIASGGYQNTNGGASDAMLVKFTSAGVRLWGTYYGGSGAESAAAVAVDGLNNVVIAGSDPDGAILVKFSSAGLMLWVHHTGGTGFAGGTGVAVDGSGDCYLSGRTDSPDGIASGGHQNTIGGGGFFEDAFLVKVSTNGVFQWGTYYGGSGQDQGTAVCVDGSGNVYLAGDTESNDGIANGGHQNTFGGGFDDAFLAKFTPTGVIIWASYYGGTGTDYGTAVAVDNSDNVYLSGSTNGSDGIASGGYQNTFGGGLNDAFLAKFSSVGLRQWGTYYGGAGIDQSNSVAVEGSTNVYISGWTNSIEGIASGGYQNTYSDGNDALLVSFSSAGDLQWGSYYGNVYTDISNDVIVDGSGDVYITGFTGSTSVIDPNLISPSDGGHQTTYGGGFYDAFLTKFTAVPPVPVITNVSIPNVPMKVGDVVTATISVDNDPAVFTLPVGSTIAGFALSNLVKTNNTTYTAQFTVASGGADIPAASTVPVSVMLDGPGGNSAVYSTAVAQANDPIDVTNPTITSINYQTPATSPTNATSLTFRVIFSEAVLNVDAADFTKTVTGGVTSGTVSVAVVNATTYNITVPTVTGSGTVRLDVLNTATITDAAGNAYTSNFTTGQVYTIDQTLPVFSATAPLSNSTVSDARVSYTLSEALASGTITWTRTGGAADGTIHIQTLTGTELAIGAHTNIILTNNPTLVSGAIYSVAFAGTDAVGNAATIVTNTNVTVDNTPPTVTSISYQTPATSPTNATSLTFQVIFSKAVVNVDAADFTKTVTGGVTSGTVSVAVVNATTYNITVPTVTGSGTVRLDVLNTATITDAGGNAYASNFTTGQVYTIDQALPVFSATAPLSNSTVSDARVSYTLSEALASGTITWTRTGGAADGTIHTQPLTGTELAIGAHTNILLTNNPTLVSGAIYSVAFAGSDAVGNAATVVTNTNVTFDNILPTVTSISYQTPATSPTNATSLIFQIIFSKAVVNVDAADFTKAVTGGLTSGIVSVAPVNATTYNVTVPTVAGSGTVRLDVLNTATITDAGGNPYASNFTSGQVYTIDQTLPVFSATAPLSNSTVSDARVSYTLSEALASGTITWTRTGGTADGTIHTQPLTGTELAIGPHSNITLANNPTLVSGAIYSVAFAGTDAVGNAALVVTNTNVTYTVDAQAPNATFNPLNGSINVAAAGNITITFDEAVRKIDNTAITSGDLSTLVELKLTNNAGALVPFSATIDGTNRIITVNPTSDLTFNTVYYVEINPVEDASNNATVAASITFTTSNAAVPVITAVSIPNVAMKIGDVVTVTISVNNDPAVLTLPVGSTIAGFALSNLVKTNNTTYTAQFTVASGGSDIAAGSTIPVNVVINGAGGNSATYTTGITQVNDPVDVTVPTVLSVNYQTPASSPTNATSLTFRVTFSEAVLNVTAPDFTKTFTGLSSGTSSVSAVNPTTYDITVPTVSGSGTARLDVLNTATINDVAGNAYTSSFTTGQIYAVDQTVPVFSATAPVSNSTVSNAQVSYTLSETIASGTITWTRTGGSADGTIHAQTLTGTELTIGSRTNIILTNNPTLVSGAIYSVAFAGIDAAGNAASLVTNTNITVAPATGNLSDIVANNSFIYPQNIEYISFLETNNIQNSPSSLNVAKFDVRDGGASSLDPDVLPTIITGITLDLGANYTMIRRIALYNESGTVELAGTEQVVSSQQISFSNLTITCDDNRTTSFTIRVSFSDQVIDNQQFSIGITAATAQTSGSGLASANAGGAVSSTANNSNRVEVIATKLKFIQQPSTTSVNVSMAPPVTLEVVDVNENRDLDFSGSAGLSSQGLLDSNPAVSFTSGLGTSSAIIFGTAGVGFTLTTTNTVGLTDATSSSFDVEDDSEGLEPAIHAFITPNTADNQNNVLYIKNIELYPVNKVQLINRWGVTVKSWINFSNYGTSDPTQADFDFTGLSVGNYICIVEYANSTGSDKKSQSQMISVLK